MSIKKFFRGLTVFFSQLATKAFWSSLWARIRKPSKMFRQDHKRNIINEAEVPEERPEVTSITTVREIVSKHAPRLRMPSKGIIKRIRDWRAWSLRTKMMGLISTVVMATSLAGGISAFWVASSALENEIRFTGEQLVLSLAGTITTQIRKPGAEVGLRVALNKLIRKDDEKRIKEAYILNKDFTILAASNKKLVGKKYTGPAKLDKGKGLQTLKVKEHLIVKAPVEFGKGKKKKTLGYVVFSFSQNTVDRAQFRIFWLFLLVFVVALALGAGVTYLALKALLQPVVKLGKAAAELADGNFDYEIKEPEGRDEIAVAIHSFITLQKAQRHFMRFSNPALVRKILKGLAPDKAEELKLTVGFGDGVGFTDWSEPLAPQEVLDRLTEYFTLAGKLIEEMDGMVDKHIGDAIMFCFGVEGEKGNKYYVQNAIRATFLIQQTFFLANFAFKKFHGHSILQFRFALSTGLCVVGPMGAKGVKMDYTVIGTDVNLASRLEGLADYGGVALSSISHVIAGDEFVVADGPLMAQIKGFKEPVPFYKLKGFREPAENEKQREFLLNFFRRDDVKEVLQLNREQYQEFSRKVEGRLSKKALVLPVPF